MKLNFSQKQQKTFKKLLNIKNFPSYWDSLYIKKATKYIKLIKWIPWLKMIWVWNSTSMNSWKQSSDIDLFIVTSENRLWLNRFLITIIFSFLWIKKTHKRHKWKLCLSFFVNEESLNFENIAIKNDIYLYFRILYFKPILNYDWTYEKFIEANSSWCNFEEQKSILYENEKYIKYRWNPCWDKSQILDQLEKIIKKIWLPKTTKSYTKLGKPYWIIINDNMLKFHNNDKRKEIRNKVLKK